jgi:N-acetylglucosaminyldiphosphoundecaprenol N-acetyl-beta-D-mannosaminyltransferase
MIIDFFGIKISCLCQTEQLDYVDQAIRNNKHSNYVTYTNAHVAVLAKKDEHLKKAINDAYIALPDGMSIVVSSKIKGIKCIEKSSGPDMMDLIIKNGIEKGYTHFFYGSTQSTLNLLEKKLRQKYDKIKILGMYTPPFRKLTNDEDEEIIRLINDISPDCIWIGLGAPKQELWMHEHYAKINRGVMFGVGAAFDFHAGTVKRAPIWMQKNCLEWLFRLIREPKRLWKRYFITNFMFLFYLIEFGIDIIDDQDIYDNISRD